MWKNKNLNNLGEKNLKTVCRLCLMDGYFLREVYGTKIPYMIEYCLNINVSSQNQLPTKICARCFRQIVHFYTFKRKTERNDRALKEVIRLRSNTKDLINIALQNSEINPLHSESEYCSISKKPVKIINKNGTIMTDDEPSEYQNNVYHKPVPSNNIIWDLSVPSNPHFGTFQRQQIHLSSPYNIEPPPLAPLQSNSNLNRNAERNLHSSDFLINTNFLSVTDILQPPPLVAITPVKPVSDIAEGRITAGLTKLSCNTCKQEFESLHSLQDHHLNSCRLVSYECNMCKLNFADQKKLATHLKSHRTTKEHLCNVCGKRYSNQSTFIIHSRSHTGERPFKCNICGKGFVRWAGVKNHMKTHEDFKPYKCETCDKQFKDISNLYRHQRLHTGNCTFCCSFCGKAFYQSHHLVLHIRTYHTKEKPYLCCECGKGFVSFQRLKRHELVHSGQKPYPCTLCLRAYSNRIDLKNHNLRVHNKNDNLDEIKKYSCTVCGLRFWHPCRLKKHMNTHGNPKKKC